jgi:transcriptional regulator with XRE-family HTH domain
MEANNLKQTDLATELGGQSVVSAILRGKRDINAGQAVRLARKFKVSAAIFIGTGKLAAEAPIAPAAELVAPYKIVGSNFTPITPAYLADSASIQYVQ